ncbi:MAG: UDP-N-acetylmuramoyl-tripeptide--D-alanyl-D-alanine ligase [Flavisolibacter sp.]
MKMDELYTIYLSNPSVQTDTRKLKKGDLFFALKGPSFDGNEFAIKAIESGASYAVIDDETYFKEGKTILVNDVLDTLQQLALHHRKQLDIPFIAITGSNGKTTTKELIHAVLSSIYKTYTTEGNLNNHIGVPLTILKIRKDAEMAVIEMGANHINEIASYCKIALPTHGLITNCGKAHLEGFGGVEGVRRAKGELYDHLRANDGTAFVMWDFTYLQEMSKGIQHIYKYGTSNADLTGFAESSDPFLHVKFTKGYNGLVKTMLVGEYNLSNVLAAMATGIYFSVPTEKCKNALENYSPSNSRSQLLQKGSNQIILDAYNANPSSMKAAIENFAKTVHSNKILILGGMAELGESSKEEHESIVDEIKKYKWDHVLLAGGDFMKIKHPFIQFSTADEAGKWLQRNKIENSYFLIKGSRSMQMEKILNYVQ